MRQPRRTECTIPQEIYLNGRGGVCRPSAAEGGGPIRLPVNPASKESGRKEEPRHLRPRVSRKASVESLDYPPPWESLHGKS